VTAVELMDILQQRFDTNMGRHKGMKWEIVKDRLEKNPQKVKSLKQMEESGSEPDVIGVDPESGELIFCDCSKETPAGRKNTCYDSSGEQMRIKKKIYPAGNAIDMASIMGIELLDEEGYRKLQEIGEFDTRTSSWIKTPSAIREKGGAIFGDYRYGQTFIYHNSAQSFYSSRGFRGILRV